MKSVALILGLFILCTLVSCRSQTAPQETANVIGQVVLDSSEILTPPYSGIEVSLEGTGDSTMTNDSGRFELPNIPGGTYTMRWSKPGYGEVRYIGVAIQGGGNTPVYISYNGNPTRLRKYSSLVTSLLSASFDTSGGGNTSQDYLILSGSYTDMENVSYYQDAIAFYFSHSSNVSPVEGTYAGYYTEPGYDYYPETNPEFVMDTVNKTFRMGYDIYGLTAFNFYSGDSIYIAAYGAPVDNSFDYLDPVTDNEPVLTSYNQTPSRVIGLKIP
jgi:hypothetical protein